MTRLSPIAVLFLFGFIGIVTHRLGLWLPFGIIAAVIAAGFQKRRALSETSGEGGLAAMRDADLLLAYQRTDGVPGDRAADVLLAEIERRELDI
jgi:hypothetical protein